MEWVLGCGNGGARGGGRGRVRQWAECGGGGGAVFGLWALRWEFGEGTADKGGPDDGGNSCAVFWEAWRKAIWLLLEMSFMIWMTGWQ